MKRVRTIAIAGAGLSGLAVAVALRDAGFDGSIGILDAKRSFENDRTWCWWKMDDVPFAEIASRRWTQFHVSCDRGAAIATSTAHPYLHVSGADYYAACLSRLERTSTTISLDEQIVAISDEGGSVNVRTVHRDVRADLVVDARGRREGSSVQQHFFGVHLMTEEPIFNPDVVTLMDFAHARNGIRFTYVLPFSPYEALVEDTVVDAAVPNIRERRLGIERYLRERYGLSRWRELRTEAGAIPLDARRIPAFASARIVRAGIAAGATRASSGYNYVRAHRHAARIADFVMTGKPISAAGSPLSAFLDDVALKAVQSGMVDVPRIVTELFAHVSGDAIARFLSDVASPLDMMTVTGTIARALPAALRHSVRGVPAYSP